jgi:hypothetical protein
MGVPSDLTVDERERMRRAFRNAAFKPGFSLALLALPIHRFVGKDSTSAVWPVLLGVMLFGGFALGIAMGVRARRREIDAIETDRRATYARAAAEPGR